MEYQPIIIIGAARSGTNMLRDVLTKLPGCATWPCDEINYLWRHGNIRFPSDEFPQEFATARVNRFISKQFGWVSTKYRSSYVVEKTCANSLRVGFVHKLLPNAKFVVIRRNSLDAVSSALKRWKSAVDIPYLVRKSRFVPIVDLPYYSSRYFYNLLFQLVSSKDRLAIWGPRFSNIRECLASYPLDEVCALQWKKCVDHSTEALHHIPSRQQIHVAYEEFVSEPFDGLRQITDFLEIECNKDEICSSITDVSNKSVGKGVATFTDVQADRLLTLMEDTLSQHGYA